MGFILLLTQLPYHYYLLTLPGNVVRLCRICTEGGELELSDSGQHQFVGNFPTAGLFRYNRMKVFEFLMEREPRTFLFFC